MKDVQKEEIVLIEIVVEAVVEVKVAVEVVVEAEVAVEVEVQVEPESLDLHMLPPYTPATSFVPSEEEATENQFCVLPVELTSIQLGLDMSCSRCFSSSGNIFSSYSWKKYVFEYQALLIALLVQFVIALAL